MAAGHVLYCMKTDPTYGRGLYATRYLEAGMEILRDDPVAYSLSVGAAVCFSCLAKSSPLKKCLQCGSVVYCNKRCQSDDWPQHRLECRGLASMDDLTKADSLMMRLLVKVMYTSGVVGLMSSFTSNGCQYSDVCIEIDTDLNGAEEFVGKCQPKLAPLDKTMGCKLLRMIMCNSFTIFTVPYQDIGEGIYLQGALLNHSCEPNCYCMFEGKTLVIRTLKRVRAGEQLFICYVNPLNPVEHNPQFIKRLYGFVPRCVHCDDIGMEDVIHLFGLCELYESKDWKGMIRYVKRSHKYKNVMSRIRAAQLYYVAMCGLNEEQGKPINTKPVLHALETYQKLCKMQSHQSPWDTWFAMQELYSMAVVPLALQGGMAGAA